MVSWLEAGDAGSDAVHIDTLMAENATGRTGRNVAFEDVQIGATNRCFGDFDDGVARHLKGGLGTIFQGFQAGTAINRSFHGQYSI